MANTKRDKELELLMYEAQSILEAQKIADRERSGCLMAQSGRIVRKRKSGGQYVSQVRNIDHGTSGTHRPIVQVKPGPEVRAWDAMVKADRVLVGMGCRSALVRVIKGVPKSTAIQLAMVAAGAAKG